MCAACPRQRNGYGRCGEDCIPTQVDLNTLDMITRERKNIDPMALVLGSVLPIQRALEHIPGFTMPQIHTSFETLKQATLSLGECQPAKSNAGQFLHCMCMWLTVYCASQCGVQRCILGWHCSSRCSVC